MLPAEYFQITRKQLLELPLRLFTSPLKVGGAAGSKILFAGGWEPGINSSRVDVYDTATHAWSTAELTVPERDGMVVATVGSKIFFAGGNNDWVDVTSRIDIYDAATDTWSIAELSQARNYLAAATLGNKVFFAGGGIWGPISGGSPNPNWPPDANYHIGSNVVDIYDNSTNTWTTATLSEGRFELSATVAGNKIYFAGGYHSIFSGSTKIDIYDATANSWSTSQLNEVKASHGVVAIDDKIYWAAGSNTPYWEGHHLSDLVEIKNITTGVSSFDCITPKAMFSVIAKNDNIVFFTGYNNGTGNKFDIYNTTTKTWSIGELPVDIHGSAIISVNNTIYIAGGNVNGVYSKQVWKLEF